MSSVREVVAGRLIRATALADDTRLASRVVRHECRAADEALCINGAQILPIGRVWSASQSLGLWKKTHYHSLSLGIMISSTSLFKLEAKDFTVITSER